MLNFDELMSLNFDEFMSEFREIVERFPFRPSIIGLFGVILQSHAPEKKRKKKKKERKKKEGKKRKAKDAIFRHLREFQLESKNTIFG